MKHQTIAKLKSDYPKVASALSRAYAVQAMFGNRKVAEASMELPLPSHTLTSIKRGSEIDPAELTSAVAGGDVIVAKGLLQGLGLWEQTGAIVRRGYGLELDDLGRIHTRLSAGEILERTAALKLDADLLTLECTLLRSLFASDQELYAELMPNLRPHLPFEYVQAMERDVERDIGRGKMNPHGPHKDSWRFHPKNTINVWLSLAHATPQNGMFLVPDSQDYYPQYAENEIVQGCHTYPERQYHTRLEPGDAVIFAAELLHGSLLNQTDATRFAFSMRCTTQRPDFHQDFMYNYVRLKPSFSNLTRAKLVPSSKFRPPAEQTESPSFGPQASRLDLEGVTATQIRVNTPDGVRCYPRRCPHKGVDLQHGTLEGGCVVCPQHQMRVKPLEQPGAGRPADGDKSGET